MRYEDPRRLEHGGADVLLRSALTSSTAEDTAFEALVGLALYDDDRDFVEQWCIRLGTSAQDPKLSGLAALCIGSHLARRFGSVSPEAANLVRALARDEVVVQASGGQALDALEDLNHFTHRSLWQRLNRAWKS